PVANYVSTQTVTKCPPITIKFKNKSSSDANYWKYIFNDKGKTFTTMDSAKADTVQYRFTRAGIYPIELVVKNTLGCIDTTIVDSIIVGGPSTNFDFNPKAG